MGRSNGLISFDKTDRNYPLAHIDDLTRFWRSKVTTAIECTCTKFGVDSSSRFSVRAQTNRQTRLNTLPTLAAVPVWVATTFIMVPVSDRQRKGNSACPLVSNLVVDEERMRPGHWLRSVLCALTLLVG